MADGVAEEVIEVANETAPNPQIVILNFGDNDIREGGQLQAILSYFEELMEQLTEIPFCRVVLTSLVPDRYKQTKEDFNNLNHHLRILCNGNPKASFCDFTHQLFEDGRLNAGLYKDNVHLNFWGSKLMAESIYQHLVDLPIINGP